MNDSIRRRLRRVANQIEEINRTADLGPSGDRVFSIAKDAVNEAISYVDSIAKGMMSHKKSTDNQDLLDKADDVLKEISVARKHLMNARGML